MLKRVPSAQIWTAGLPIQQLINFLQSVGWGNNPFRCGHLIGGLGLVVVGFGVVVVVVEVVVEGGLVTPIALEAAFKMSR